MSLMFHWIFSIMEENFRFLAGSDLNRSLLFFTCTFVLIQKYQKIKTANKSLKFYSITLRKINSLRSDNIFRLTLHYVKFLNVIYLRSEQLNKI